ncbi:MAG: PTS sugar transporter subunit IIB [Erysipelotrichaceae bacterium]
MRILLMCSAGMSTSMLVNKMIDAADEKNVDATIWAVGEVDCEKNIKMADIVLLGPQVRFLLEKTQKIARDIPVRVIDMMQYSTMNGAAVLDEALKVLEEYN